ncbi:hypothetical protein [Rhizobium sp. BT03]|uniref:hypothetical protein n=1 Tax=Rhizobium sp. BT03 TaxID=3045156 RepID=UPI0024B3D73B|nr:hypothetical protein [Rhizobium sp. BT03]WHO75882.1 hypothetical protein QMO80_004988 [Rhizobium sp. BT03]
MDRIGYQPDTTIPFLGDAYFENQLIDTQLRQLVGEGLGRSTFIAGNRLKGSKYEGTEAGDALAKLIGASLMAGITGAIGGGDAAAYGVAEYQYNYLTHERLAKAIEIGKALAACKGVFTNCAEYASLKSQVDDFVQESATNTRNLIAECSKGVTPTCESMMKDLEEFNATVDAELNWMQNNPRGPSAGTDPTPTMARYYEAVDSGLRLDHAVAEQFTAVLAGDIAPEQARRNIIKSVVQSTKDLGELRAVVDGAGLIGAGVMIVLSDGTLLPLVAGGLGTVSSGSHLYGDIEQSLTGVITEPGLVQLLLAGGLSGDDALAMQSAIDVGALVAGFTAGGKAVFELRYPERLTVAERNSVGQILADSATQRTDAYHHGFRRDQGYGAGGLSTPQRGCRWKRCCRSAKRLRLCSGCSRQYRHRRTR